MTPRELILKWRQYPKEKPTEKSRIIAKRAFGEVVLMTFESNLYRRSFLWIDLDSAVKTIDHNTNEHT